MSLARASYARSDLIVLDDPLSAVDTKVGEHIFRHLICGFLKGRTRILVTHNIPLAIPDSDIVVYVNRGKTLQCKPVELTQALNNNGLNDDSSASQFEGLLVEASLAAKQAICKDAERLIEASDSNKALIVRNRTGAGQSLIQSESKVKGSVGWEIYLHYGKACGGVYVILGYALFKLSTKYLIFQTPGLVHAG